jgi:hypothetical protein
LVFPVAFFAVHQQHGSEYTRFFYAVEWKGCEQTVVQLELDTYQVLELLQCTVTRVSHMYNLQQAGNLLRDGN